MIKLGKLYENNGAYVSSTPDEDKALFEDLRYICFFNDTMHTIQHAWTSDSAPARIQLPPIDYASGDFKSVKGFEECKVIMKSESKTALIRRKQKNIVETIAQGKVNIGTSAFARVCPKHRDSAVSLVVTGNASIKFMPSGFGKGVFELILPPDMQLYKVKDKDSRSRVCTNERYLIASNIIDPSNLDYSDEMIESVFDTTRVMPITEVKTPELLIKVNPNLVYHRGTESILTRPEFQTQLQVEAEMDTEAEQFEKDFQKYEREKVAKRNDDIHTM